MHFRFLPSMDAAQKKGLSPLLQNSSVLWRIDAVQYCAILRDVAEPPVFLAELCRQQAEHVLKTWLSFVECALGMSSGKDFICQLAVQGYWVSKKEMLSLRNI